MDISAHASTLSVVPPRKPPRPHGVPRVVAGHAPARELRTAGFTSRARLLTPRLVSMSGATESVVAGCSTPAKAGFVAGSSGSFAATSREARPLQPAEEARLRSKVIIFDLTAGATRIVYEGNGVIEAPNWSRDNEHLLVNMDGDLYWLPLNAPEPRGLEKVLLGQGFCCNNDHDWSPDGSLIAFSATSPTSSKSQVYVCDADGSGVRLVTAAAPSYFHGWSPDGEWLVFVAERGNGNFELYRVRAAGGAEQRLTRCGGYDDGPEYSPDAKWIYFNSNRSGCWNLWRMPATGAGPGDAHAEQVTSDAPEDWFPHLSPDGRFMVFMSFPPGTQGHDCRMAGTQLRLLRSPGSKIDAREPQVLLEFFGGQGSMNVNSWSPDSEHFAFVIFEPVE